MTRQVRWLDDDERAAWLALASLSVRLGQALNAQLLRDAGITHFEYTVMAALSEAAEKTLRMSDLAFLADGSLPRLSQVVSRLEKRGWVERHPDPIDGRITLASLTGAGMDKVVETAPGHVEEVRRIVFDPLTTAQVAQLTRIAERINDAIGPDRCRTASPHP